MFQLDNLLFFIQILTQIPDDMIDIVVKQMIDTARRTKGSIVILADLFKQLPRNQRARYFTPMAQYLGIQEKINILDNLENTVLKTEFFDLIFLIPGTKIFLFDADQSSFDNSFSNVNYDGFQIYGLSDYMKTWVLDSSVSNLKDRALNVHKVVNLDLNVLQFFNRYSQGRLNQHKGSMEKLLSYFKNNNFEYNMSTAMMERSKKTFEIKDKTIWNEIINNYLKFIRSDSTVQNYTVVNLSEEEKITASEMIDSIGNFSDKNLGYYDIIACLVSKAFLIKMDNNIKNKLDMLLEYSLDVLNVYLENEIILLDAYFKQNASVSRTFNKIEGVSKDTKNKILNTIWDIFHVRLMEVQMYSENKKEDIFLHYFSSHDKAFEELLLYNPLKMFVIHDGKQYAIRERGIVSICNNNLLNKISSEAKKRSSNVNNVDFKTELTNLFSEITKLQDKQFNK